MNTAMSLLAHDVTTLRLVGLRGPASLAILRGAEREPVTSEPLLARLVDLVGLELVQRSRRQKGGPVLYALTAAGTAALREHDRQNAAAEPAPAPAADPAPGIVGTSRTYVKPPNYDGAELRPYMGRGLGALRAFTLPSLVNGVTVERKGAPLIMASTKPDRLRDGRGR